MTPIPDGHPSIEAVHIPGEGVLHPVDPDVAPTAPEVAAVEDPPADEPDGSTKRRRTTRADAEPTEEA